MCDSAMLKVKRASKGVRDLNELFRERRPFTYVIETNTKTGERATFPKKNKPVVDESALLSGEIVHNLRSALDHAYWEIVSPFAKTDRERKKIQFPFCETAARLEIAVKDRLAGRVSPSFFKALIGLKPYGEAGGNELLYLIDKMDILDKHKLLIPTGDYTTLSSDVIRKLIPDFPFNLTNVGVMGARRHATWKVPAHTLRAHDIGALRPPTTYQFEKEIDVPVDIVFNVGAHGTARPVVPTLNAMVDVAQETIKIIRAAAS